MTRRLGAVAALAAMTLALGACGEKPQSMDVAARQIDGQPWAGSQAANPAHRAAGWKDGDKTAWEQQIRQRTQAQNDYVR
ncbi:MAG TPA: hypothetical protein VIP10_15880 [Burkholderiaceae bacterium]